LLVLALAAVATARPGDPALFPAAGEAVAVDLVGFGHHSGLALPRPAVAAIAERRRLPALARVAERFAAYPWIEIGWGEEEFYRNVPPGDPSTLPMALRALFRPGNGSVIHVMGVPEDPRRFFPEARLTRLPLAPAGLERLLARLETAFAGDGSSAPVELGPGLAGTSAFYGGVETFSILRVYNHWTADLLDAAGVPTAPVAATLPHGLFWDLRLRSGLAPLPPPAGAA
jgi:hypothetical protein